jgi:signal transduction histidine kinase
MSSASLATIPSAGDPFVPSTEPNEAHAAQFYGDASFLFERVASFLEAGVAAGGALVIVATPANREGITRRLAELGVEVERVLVALDAREQLNEFMRDGSPQPDLLRASMDRIMDLARARVPGCKDRAMRTYGEMADLLCQDGNWAGAVRLERLWNEVGPPEPFAVMCGYQISRFSDQGRSELFDHVCSSHAMVSPTEGFPGEGDEGRRLREVARLQQCAGALDHELEQRKRSEAFLAVLGHDLRNPLSCITTAAHLLARRAESDKVLMPAARILRSADRMERMVDQLLDFTRVRLGKGLPIRRGRADLGEVCRVTIEELESSTGVDYVNIDADADTAGEWDAERLRQLASNLIENAITHGCVGSPVFVRVADQGASVGLEVSNAGAVPPELLPVLFEPLRNTADYTETRSSGLGLGLYLSHQIVLAHGGTIAVTSSEATGTRFAVTLPRTLSVSDAPAGNLS